jgi:hypothetical protein
MMDELRSTIQIDRFVNIRAHFITSRGLGSILSSPLFLAHAIVRLLLLRLLGRVDVAHINHPSAARIANSSWPVSQGCAAYHMCYISMAISLRFFGIRGRAFSREKSI